MANSSYRRDNSSPSDDRYNQKSMSIFDLLCGCCKNSSPKAEILLEDSSFGDMERKQFTIMFNQCPKGIGIRIESTLQGPKVIKISAQRWNKLQEADKILSINNENCVDSSPEVVQFLLMNLYEQNEAIFEIERGGMFCINIHFVLIVYINIYIYFSGNIQSWNTSRSQWIWF